MTPEAQKQREDQERERRRAEQDARKWGIWNDLLRGVGRRYEKCRLAAYQVTNDKQRAVVESLNAYAREIREHAAHGDNVVLFGPPGTGKDHLLIGLAHIAIGEGLTVQWLDGQSLYQKFRDAIDRDEPEASIIDRAAKPDILLLSDPVPPRGELTDYQVTILWRVVDRRYRDMKPTWISLNVASGEEAVQRMGSAIVDRLRDGATYGWCGWESFRKPAE